MGFPDSSVGKESACNAGDPGSLPGSGRSTGEGIGYSWLSQTFPSHFSYRNHIMKKSHIPSQAFT